MEYYIDSSQEPDFEENEFIYDDIIGIDDVEYSGTGKFHIYSILMYKISIPPLHHYIFYIVRHYS